MSRAGVRRAIGFIMAAQASYSSCQQYRENVRDARQRLREDGEADIEVTYVPGWFDAPGLHRGQRRSRAAGEGSLARATTHSASLDLHRPQHSARAWPSGRSIGSNSLQSSRRVAERVGISDWSLVYQSRSGRPQDPWLEPDVCDYLRQAKREGVAAAVLCPIGFVCDHVEVLYDLDREAADVAREIDLPLVRAEAVNDDAKFVDMMAEIVTATVRRYASGRPLEIGHPRSPMP